MDHAAQQSSIQKLLSTQEGQQLVEKFSQAGGDKLRKAGAALSQGNAQEAQRLMGPLLAEPQIQRLLKALEREMGHG